MGNPRKVRPRRGPKNRRTPKSPKRRRNRTLRHLNLLPAEKEVEEVEGEAQEEHLLLEGEVEGEGEVGERSVPTRKTSHL